MAGVDRNVAASAEAAGHDRTALEDLPVDGPALGPPPGGQRVGRIGTTYQLALQPARGIPSAAESMGGFGEREQFAQILRRRLREV